MALRPRAIPVAKLPIRIVVQLTCAFVPRICPTQRRAAARHCMPATGTPMSRLGHDRSTRDGRCTRRRCSPGELAGAAVRWTTTRRRPCSTMSVDAVARLTRKFLPRLEYRRPRAGPGLAAGRSRAASAPALLLTVAMMRRLGHRGRRASVSVGTADGWWPRHSPAAGCHNDERTSTALALCRAGAAGNRCRPWWCRVGSVHRICCWGCALTLLAERAQPAR